MAGQPGRRGGTWWGVASMLASAASYGAFALHARWHWELVRIQRAGDPPPAWPR